MRKQILLSILSTTAFAVQIFPPLRMMTDKASDWPLTPQTQIVIGNQATPSDSFTAYQLSLDVSLFTGVLPAVVRESQVTAAVGKRILLGRPGRDTLLTRLLNTAGIALSDSVTKPDTFGYKRIEGYEIDCGTDILIAAASDEGVFYGSRTLFMLMDTAAGAPVIHKIRGTDWPHLSIRGHMIDCGRGPYALNYVKRLIRLYSRVKLNTLQIHLYDDQLMGLKFATLPLGSENPRAWTLTQYADLVTYGKKYHIEIMPEFECGGHSGSIVYWYKDLYGSTGLSKNLNMNDPRSYWLYEDMFTDIFPYIESGFLHVGTDEIGYGNSTPDLGRLQAIVDRLNRRFGKQVHMVHWVEGARAPDSCAARIYANTWYYSGIGAGSGPNPDQDSLIRFGKEKVIGGSAGWAGDWKNSYQWVNKYKYEKNFIGLIASHWSENTADNHHEKMMSTAVFSWNCDADTNMYPGQWGPFQWRYEELQMPETRYLDNAYTEAVAFADPLKTPDDYFKYSVWNPTNPAQNDTLGYVQDGIYKLTGLPVAPTVAYDMDTLVMHAVPVPDTNFTVAAESRRLGSLGLTASPNPFSGYTRILVTGFRSGNRSPSRLTIHDVRGRRIRLFDLASNQKPEASNDLIWNGLDANGAPLPAGVYLCRLVTGDKRFERKIVMLK